MERASRQQAQRALLQRFENMGLQARLMDGERCVLASMSLRSETFEGLATSHRTPKVLFSTLGNDRIKCLRPRFLFQLPPIHVRDCRNASAIELAIHRAWDAYLQELRAAHDWLRGLGLDPKLEEEESVLAFPLDGEERDTHVRMTERRQAILPSCGPLSGTTLANPQERVFAIDPAIRSGIDLGMSASTRIDQLKREKAQRDSKRRHESILHEAPVGFYQMVDKRTHRVLLVGPRLSRERAVMESLRLRGYEVLVAKNEKEALDAFDAASPELVMADMDLGRSEGLELILSLRQICGIENVPIVLVDTERRTPKRQAAREVGAAGYLVYPLDVPRIANHLSSLVADPARRRFTRYPERLPLTLPGTSDSGMLTALSRGGMFVTTNRDLPVRSVHEFEVRIPQMGRTLRVQAEAVYQLAGAGSVLSGVGMRFHQFAEESEHVLIDFLRTLDDD